MQHLVGYIALAALAVAIGYTIYRHFALKKKHKK
jgi:hypothetical protein